jgi:cell division protein FtsL
MPRLRLRLATLSLLIAIIASACAVVAQWRHDLATARRMRLLENENQLLQKMLERQEKLLEVERAKHP